jgi:hypothetical protein
VSHSMTLICDRCVRCLSFTCLYRPIEQTRVRTCALPIEWRNEVEVSPIVDYRMNVAEIV